MALNSSIGPRIEVSRLVKRFKRVGGASLVPVNEIDLVVDAREMVILLGPSGCGKTTLLRCVAGLERPDSGEIVLDGKVVFSSAKGIFVPPRERQLSMIFQSFALWPHMTIFDNIAYPLASRRVPKAEIRPRVEEVMRMVGISDLERQYPGRISGGQQQRVALARALVAQSVAVLFDEPLSNVDARVREQLRVEMKRMQRDLQFSGLYVTHDQAEAMELGDRIAVLDSGRIVALGTPADIYSRPTSEYVATSLGSANLLPGKVISTGPEGVVLETPVGPLLAIGAPEAVGTIGKVIIRPERVQVSSLGQERTSNTISGTVTSRVFTGPFIQIFVECQGLTLRALCAEPDIAAGLAEGTTAHLWVDPRAVGFMPADPAPNDPTLG